MRPIPVSSGSSAPSWNDPRARRAAAIAAGLPVRAALAAIRAYKVLFSPWFAGSCRFVPSCADYASEAIARHGAVRGIWLAARRLGRCHPFGGHGFDPVPTLGSCCASDDPDGLRS